MEPRTYQNVAQGAFGGPTGAEITLAASATTEGPTEAASWEGGA